jgi:hypothetical protein
MAARTTEKPVAAQKTTIDCHVKYCGAIDCHNSRSKNPELTFFGFPKPGKTRKNAEEQLQRYVSDQS